MRLARDTMRVRNWRTSCFRITSINQGKYCRRYTQALHKAYLESTRIVDAEITLLDVQDVIAQLHNVIDGEGK